MSRMQWGGPGLHTPWGRTLKAVSAASLGLWHRSGSSPRLPLLSSGPGRGSAGLRGVCTPQQVPAQALEAKAIGKAREHKVTAVERGQ